MTTATSQGGKHPRSAVAYRPGMETDGYPGTAPTAENAVVAEIAPDARKWVYCYSLHTSRFATPVVTGRSKNLTALLFDDNIINHFGRDIVNADVDTAIVTRCAFLQITKPAVLLRAVLLLLDRLGLGFLENLVGLLRVLDDVQRVAAEIQAEG